jgi:A1 cistron-splicing factor AAR2
MVIIDNIPSSTTDTDFHLLIVKKSNTLHNNGGGHALPVGFILVPTTTVDDDGYYDWTFVRKYDIYNEEISNVDKPMDEISMKNLLLALRNGELYHCTIQYDQFMKNNATASTTSYDSNGGLSSPNDDAIGHQYGNNSNGNQCLPSWDVRTYMINSNFLHVCHDIEHGCKIVPSSNIGSRGSTYGSTTTDTANDDDATNNTVVKDGKSITYPAIPCIDTTITNNIRLVTRHTGTRLYLSTLSPKERTRLLFVNSSVDDDDDRKETEENNNNAERSQPVGENVFEDVLRRYDNSNNNGRGDISCSKGEEYFLADIELSFLLFIHLECHVSLEHWRDSISMCALATITAAARSSAKTITTSIVYRRSSFFHTLLLILYKQLLCIEVDFFCEVEYSAGEENFLVVALQRLYSACATAQQQSDSVNTAAAASKRKRGNDSSAAAASTIENLKSASLKLKRLLIDRFGLDLSTTTNKEIDDVADDDDDDDMESDALWSTMGHDYVNDDEDTDEIADLQQEGNAHHRESMDIGHVKDSSNNNTDDDEDDDDGPVIIPYEDVEASLARSTLLKTINQRHQLQVGKAQRQQCEKYPLLYAAMSSGEDEVMACARILDEARDVSLVREAASYLEEVESIESGECECEKKGDIFSLGSSRINKYKY